MRSVRQHRRVGLPATDASQLELLYDHQARTWYLDQGFVEGETLFTTSEVGGFNDAAVDATIVAIKDQLDGDDW